MPAPVAIDVLGRVSCLLGAQWLEQPVILGSSCCVWSALSTPQLCAGSHLLKLPSVGEHVGWAFGIVVATPLGTPGMCSCLGVPHGLLATLLLVQLLAAVQLGTQQAQGAVSLPLMWISSPCAWLLSGPAVAVGAWGERQ